MSPDLHLQQAEQEYSEQFERHIKKIMKQDGLSESDARQKAQEEYDDPTDYSID